MHVTEKTLYISEINDQLDQIALMIFDITKRSSLAVNHIPCDECTLNVRLECSTESCPSFTPHFCELGRPLQSMFAEWYTY